MNDPRETRRARWTWGVIIVAAYVLIALALGRGYPFFAFDMFSFETVPGQRAAGPLLAERADGSTHRVQAFAGWECDAPIDAMVRATCGPDEHVDFRWRRMDHRHLTVSTRAMEEEAAAESITLVRRVHEAYAEPPEAARQCIVATCRVVPAGDERGFYGR